MEQIMLASNAGVIVAPVYGTDATFVNSPAGATVGAGQNNFNITGNITAQTTTTTNTLRFNGAHTLTLGAAQTLTVRTAARTLTAVSWRQVVLQ